MIADREQVARKIADATGAYVDPVPTHYAAADAVLPFIADAEASGRAKAAAEIEHLTRERDTYATAAAKAMSGVENALDQRIQCAPVNIAWMDPIRFIVGWSPCSLGRTPAEYEQAKAEFAELRSAVADRLTAGNSDE